jgi:post-segregation antitoxin (ccd killing protein)
MNLQELIEASKVNQKPGRQWQSTNAESRSTAASHFRRWHFAIDSR